MLGSLDHLSDAEIIALSELMKSRQRDTCFDHVFPDSVPCPTQLEIMKHRGNDNEVKKIVVRAPNQVGKSTTGARIISWWFQENHPYQQRLKCWGDRPLTILVVGNNLNVVEQELWKNKIQGYLGIEGTDYKVHRSGNVISWVENIKEGPGKGNKIIFMSHHGSDNVREKIQGFTANIVWLDEMPSTASIITELLLRLIAMNGFFYATFTPLVKNDEIRKMCDQTGNGWVTFIPLADTNPKWMHDIPGYEARLRSMSRNEEDYECRRWGKWWYGSGRVIKAYTPARNRHPLPAHYNMGWRHVVIVDPAASGKAGVSVVGEDPKTNRWWVVKAFYLDGDAPSKLVRSVETLILGYNIIERRCDCNPASFYLEALEQGISYSPHREKNNRKSETIDGLNEKFMQNIIFVADSAATDVLHDELMNCAWSESNPDKIVNESSFHTLDTLRYFADRIPAPTKTPQVFDHWTQELKHNWEKQKEEKQHRREKPLNNRQSFMYTRKSRNIWK